MDEASPRFRQDLVASATEADGVPCVDVSDPNTGTSFRLYDFEYQLALQLNGQPLANVTAWAAEAYGVELTTDGVTEFAGRLRELGFLEAAAPTYARTAVPLPVSQSVTAPVVALEANDNPEAEWSATEGQQTQQFVPDPALFDSPQDLTPVAPRLPTTTPAPPPIQAAALPTTAPAIPSRLAEPPAPVQPVRAVAMSRPAEAPTFPAIPSRVLGELKPGAPTSWAAEVDTLDGKPAAAPPSDGVARAGELEVGPSLPTHSATAPAGVTERRQPPSPEAVVMSGFAEPPKSGAPATPAAPKKSARTIGIVLLVVLAGVVGYFVWRSQQGPAVQPVGVRVLVPAPAAVYRWFPGHGEVTDCETRTISFETAGRLTELMPPGTEVAAGDLVGKLQGAAQIETLLAHNRSRVAFYQQVQESMRAAGNQPELRQAEQRLAEKRRLLDETQAALARVTLRAQQPGELVETLAKVGTLVPARTPVARVKERALHGSFALAAEEGAATARLDFCRVEVIGLGPHASNGAVRHADEATDSRSPEAQNGPRFVDCSYARSEAGGKVKVTLPGDVGLVPGQPLHLARRRFDGVFPVPASAITNTGGETAVWLATAAGTAERRKVVVADQEEDVLISAGLRAGDRVILDPPSGLTAGTPIVLEP